MAAPSKGRLSPRQVRAAINRLDLEKIGAKATKTHRWPPARAREADLWYRNFLWLCYKYGSPVAAVGKDADDFWHIHIIDTRKYAADCKSVFGRFLDHVPLYGRPTAEEREMFESTKLLYLSEFGELPPFPRPISWHSRGQMGSPSA